MTGPSQFRVDRGSDRLQPTEITRLNLGPGFALREKQNVTMPKPNHTDKGSTDQPREGPDRDLIGAVVVILLAAATIVLLLSLPYGY